MVTLPWVGLLVCGVWWASTGLALALVWLPTLWRRAAFALTTLVALLSLGAVRTLAEGGSSARLVASLAVAIGLWGWHEVAFLSGALTGTRRLPASGAGGAIRFREAFASIWIHEVALAATLALLWWLSRGRLHPTVARVFTVLWVMRVSAKLNLFLGVRVTNAQFLPTPVRYLGTYFRSARFNPLMPLSLACATALAARSFATAGAASVGSYARLEAALLGCLLCLAALEHVFMVVPLQDAKLWSVFLPRKHGAES